MLWQFLVLLGVHWFADFVLQTRWQAANKSKRFDALASHVIVYTAVLSIASVAMFGAEAGPFTAVNGTLHFATDFVTSRISSRLFMAQFDIGAWGRHPTKPRMLAREDFNPHNFFVVIGLDQLIHQLTLAGTMIYFFGGR